MEYHGRVKSIRPMRPRDVKRGLLVMREATTRPADRSATVQPKGARFDSQRGPDYHYHFIIILLIGLAINAVIQLLAVFN